MMKRLAILTLITLGLTGCSTMKATDFKDTKPQLVLEDYFEGRTVAHGLFEDRFGKVRRQFSVIVEGRMEDDKLILDEFFKYNDGETETRVWEIWKTGPNTYEGKADKVVGTAKGQQYGNALNWNYKFDLDVGDDTWRVRFDDWMFLQPGGILINRAKVTKLGFEIGSVTLAFTKDAERHGAQDLLMLKNSNDNNEITSSVPSGSSGD